MGATNETLHEGAQYYIQATTAPSLEQTRVLKQDETFGVFDRYGDIDATEQGEEGIFHRGTRFLSLLKLKLIERRALLLSSTVRRDNVLLAVDLTNPDILSEGQLMLARGTLHIYRSQFLWHDTLYMRVRTRNFSLAPIEIGFLVEFGADFADIFEVRGEKRERRGVLYEPRFENGNGNIVLEYEGLDGVLRRTVIRASPEAQAILPSRLHFTVRLDPGEERSEEFAFSFGVKHNPTVAPGYADNLALATAALEQPNHVATVLSSSNEQFDNWLERSRSDLNMLLTEVSSGTYPYAGVPWFSTPFGRDGIITALECLWMAPHVARGVLAFLTETQAKELSPERDAEPGKILHEAREGEMAALGEVPFRRYYGSVDATPLYLILAGAYYRRTGDLAFIESIWPAIELASRWMDQYGDSDGDSFIEYYRHSSTGLVQQGWKDSQDSIFHADGALAEGPIALCEVQGYAYRAKLAVADIATAMGKTDLARQLARDARQLQEHFEHAFWCDAIGTYALALDGKKKPCQVKTSNAGHCLFTGIATKDHAAIVAAQLNSEAFFSGWGVRTVADGQCRYNPMSYHDGSVWPHDNALIAAGFTRYRLTELAAKVLGGLFDASVWFELNRLPELFCGFNRRVGKGPTLYPVACSPQAWSAGAAFLLLQSCVGLSIDAIQNRIILARPVLPAFLQRVNIRNLAVRDASVDLTLFRSGDAVAVTVEHRNGEVDVIVLN
jgi:glycogen debranching enzyme